MAVATRQEPEIDFVFQTPISPSFENLFRSGVPICRDRCRLESNCRPVGSGMALSAEIDGGGGHEPGAGKANGLGAFLHQFQAIAGRSGSACHQFERTGDADEVAERFTGR